MLKILFLVAAIIITSEADNEKKLCDECNCTIKDDMFTVNCADRMFDKFPDKWTKEIENKNITEDLELVLILDNNNLNKLTRIPTVKSIRIDMSFVNCDMREIDYGVFMNATSIHHLDLGYNKLTGDAVRGDTFRGAFNIMKYEPINLEVLNLEHNLIHSLDRKMFEHTPYLNILHLNDNPLEKIDLVTELAINSIQNLEVLDLSRTGISNLPHGMFKNANKLKQLFLSGNKFTTVPESIGALGNSLKYLTLNENLFESLDDNSFLGLWRVEFLEICGMKTLRDVKAGSFIQLKSLQVLHLYNNTNLEYISHEAFRELKDNWPIQELYLNNNNLRTIDSSLAPWNLLQLVNLDNNPWNCDCSMGLNLKYIKLSIGSTAKCLTPIQVSGHELLNLIPEMVCSQDMLNSSQGNPSYEFKTRYEYVYYASPSNILIGFSIVIIVIFLGVIIGVRMKSFRERLSRMSVGPIRYTNVNLH